MKIYVYVDDNGKVEGWGSTPSENTLEFDVDENHEILRNPFAFVVQDDKLVKDESEILRQMKLRKEAELNQACQDAIIAGFDYTIDGISYHFSFDLEAQLNFQGAENLFAKGVVNELTWTAQKDGEYTRITITPDLMNQLSLAIFKHKNDNISKLRDVLLPQVEAATTVEEVQAIVWE